VHDCNGELAGPASFGTTECIERRDSAEARGFTERAIWNSGRLYVRQSSLVNLLFRGTVGFFYEGRKERSGDRKGLCK